MVTTRRIPFGCLMLSVLAAALIAAPSARASTSDGPSRSYSVTLSPASVPSGSVKTITAVITNRSSSARIDTATLTPPAGFTVTDPAITGAGPDSEAEAGVSSGTVTLDDVSLRAGKSLTVTMRVTAPCTPRTTATWTTTAARYGGVTLTSDTAGSSGGNSFTLDQGRSRLNTATTGTCSLTFTGQPADARVGETITTQDYNPAGPPVAVTLLDGAGAATTASGIPVTMALAPGSSAGPLNGTKTVNTVSGVATFALNVGSNGTYILRATSGSASTTSGGVNSAPFTANQGVAICQDNILCQASAQDSGTFAGQPFTNRFTVSALDNTGLPVDGGFLFANYKTLNFTCNGHDTGPFKAMQWYGFNAAQTSGINRPKTVQATMDKNVMGGKPVAQMDFCALLPENFLIKPLSNGLNLFATNVGDLDADGNTDYVGRLPTCLQIILGLPIGPPCVDQRMIDGAGNYVIRAKLPATTKDPWGKGR